MASRSNLVNLDAMIKREDFATASTDDFSFDTVSTISIRDFTRGALLGPSLRKPDFQRETNHWSPDQVVSLLECFVNGDLIPSVILWKSPTHLFVIDGGHRLSVLKAWIEDDYGDGPISYTYFGREISEDQKKNAVKVRSLVNKKIGSWQHFQAKSEAPDLEASERQRVNTLITRSLPIQWVKGDANKAESSFFKINTKGTPLDSIEELLLKSRKKPISIAARAIIRAGRGHKYWSSFDTPTVDKIEELSGNLHKILFDPELKSPVKTLDLPLGGPRGVRIALQALIDLALIANRNQQGHPKTIYDTSDDEDGNATIDALTKFLGLARRVTGNDGGSLGLHPAVYFYGPTGRHSNSMFMGTMLLVGRKISNNDKGFFGKFTTVREKLEDILTSQKELIATILQKHLSGKRVERYSSFLDDLIKSLHDGKVPSEQELISMSGLDGKIVVGIVPSSSRIFNEDTKSGAFLRSALTGSLKCPICHGYLDTNKSVSYDHINRAREGGLGSVDNCALTHPYCNQSIKN